MSNFGFVFLAIHSLANSCRFGSVGKSRTLSQSSYPIQSMYGIFIYLHLVDFFVNVGKHTIHGLYGY